jgi:hypothetical protein
LNIDETVKVFLIGLYSTLYEILSSLLTQKCLISTSSSFQSLFTIFFVNLLPVRSTHDGGNERSLVHNLPFNPFLNVLKSELFGFGISQIFFESFEIFHKV